MVVAKKPRSKHEHAQMVQKERKLVKDLHARLNKKQKLNRVNFLQGES